MARKKRKTSSSSLAVKRARRRVVSRKSKPAARKGVPRKAARRQRAQAKPARMSRNGRGRELCLYVGTRKGAFLLRSDLGRRRWRIEGPLFSGWEINDLRLDARTGKLWAAVNSTWWGNDLQVSEDGGQHWVKSSQGLGFPVERGLNLNRLWRVQPDRASRPQTLWCGADPGALFRSDDGGTTWHEVTGLTQHATRERWDAGGGGMMVHAIALDPADEERMAVGISVAGFFYSEDDGATWKPRNQGVLADFQPTPYPEVGQCVHSLAVSPRNPRWMFQQNHCGVYRTRDAGANWEDISQGLPSRFGFAMAIHPHEPETIYTVPEISPEHRYFADARLSVWRSRNGGDRWERLTRGLPQEHVYEQVLRHAMTTDACEQAGVYLGTTGGEIYFSRDGGDRWELAHGHFPAILSLHTAIL